jgi:hypothetical protein
MLGLLFKLAVNNDPVNIGLSVPLIALLSHSDAQF